MEYGTVMSEGTAYPLAVKDGYLYFGGNHHMSKEFLDESVSSVMTKDDSHLLSLFGEYGEAKVVGFKVVE